MANLLRKGDRAGASATSSTGRYGASAVGDTSGIKKSSKSTGDTWDAAQRWIHSVAKEEYTRKQWEQMYGWMADYDAKGNLVPRKQTVENVTRFSNTVPNSRGHDYGWRLENDLGQEITSLQARMSNQHKKRRADVILGSD